MKRSSSYIFFQSPYYKKKTTKTDEKVLVIDADCIRKRLVEAFQLSDDVVGFSFFKYCYNTVFNNCDVKIKIHEVTNATYIEVEVSAKTQTKIINCLESFQDTLKEINNDNKYIVITSYDFVSEYYCNKMYPKLNELERNLRKLIFNTYTLNFGLKYFEPTIDKSIIDKSKGVIKASGNKSRKELKFIQEFPYSLDYNQLQELLFAKHWTEQETKNKNRFLENNSDLSKLSDKELRDAYKNLEPKSEWERLFADKVSKEIDYNRLLDDIRNDRNKVAHCKPFSKDEYNNCVKNVNKLNSEILNAIQITETHDFSAKNKEQIYQSFERIKKSISEIAEVIIKNFNDVLQVHTQNLTKTMLESIKSANLLNRSNFVEALSDKFDDTNNSEQNQ